MTALVCLLLLHRPAIATANVRTVKAESNSASWMVKATFQGKEGLVALGAEMPFTLLMKEWMPESDQEDVYARIEIGGHSVNLKLKDAENEEITHPDLKKIIGFVGQEYFKNSIVGFDYATREVAVFSLDQREEARQWVGREHKTFGLSQEGSYYYAQSLTASGSPMKMAFGTGAAFSRLVLDASGPSLVQELFSKPTEKEQARKVEGLVGFGMSINNSALPFVAFTQETKDGEEEHANDWQGVFTASSLGAKRVLIDLPQKEVRYLPYPRSEQANGLLRFWTQLPLHVSGHKIFFDSFKPADEGFTYYKYYSKYLGGEVKKIGDLLPSELIEALTDPASHRSEIGTFFTGLRNGCKLSVLVKGQSMSYDLKR